MTTARRPPSVLFVCVKNGGKSQMAAALMTRRVGDAVVVASAGTRPGTAVNALSAQSLAELDLDITAEIPKALTPEMVATADVVVVLGRDATVEIVPGPRFETWDTDEPSERGIDGIDRMRLVRDDIAARVDILAAELLTPVVPRPQAGTSPAAPQGQPASPAGSVIAEGGRSRS